MERLTILQAVALQFIVKNGRSANFTSTRTLSSLENRGLIVGGGQVWVTTHKGDEVLAEWER